ncbi:hypothetical protein CR513_54638, partial [Mucuna pruriens]
MEESPTELRRARKEPLFPMTMKISSPLSLGDHSTLIVFKLLDEVWGFARILEHLHTMHSP